MLTFFIKCLVASVIFVSACWLIPIGGMTLMVLALVKPNDQTYVEQVEDYIAIDGKKLSAQECYLYLENTRNFDLKQSLATCAQLSAEARAQRKANQL